MGVLTPKLGTRPVFTKTLVVAVAVQPETVTVTVYTPDIAVMAPAKTGFCKAEVKPDGPLHEYVPPPVELSEIRSPAQ